MRYQSMKWNERSNGCLKLFDLPDDIINDLEIHKRVYSVGGHRLH